MRFEWDPDKARENLRRHGVSFPASIDAFRDPLGMYEPDRDHSHREERERRIGHLADGKLGVVTFARRGSTIRIVSARRATKRERHDYESG